MCKMGKEQAASSKTAANKMGKDQLVRWVMSR